MRQRREGAADGLKQEAKKAACHCSAGQKSPEKLAGTARPQSETSFTPHVRGGVWFVWEAAGPEDKPKPGGVRFISTPSGKREPRGERVSWW